MRRCLVPITGMVFCGACVAFAHAAPFTITPESQQVRFEMPGTVATAQRVVCDVEKVVLEGTSDMPVTLTGTRNGRTSVARARRVVLSVSRGDIKLQGVEFFKVKP
jgi:hypothetical protein